MNRLYVLQISQRIQCRHPDFVNRIIAKLANILFQLHGVYGRQRFQSLTANGALA